MYNEFFGFNRAPFNNTPDPDFYFESDGHKEALATMIYGVEQGKGFVMITGDVGMGKTLLNQTLKKELGKTHVFIEISNPWSTPEEVIGAIRTSIGIEKPDNNALFDGLRERLLALSRENRRVILVIDEAHQMSERMIEGIRLLSNIETTTEKLLQIIFIGQNEFAEMMGRYSMRQIQQRLFLCHHLESFNAAETEQYIRHRLTVVDGQPDIFPSDALALIHQESQGTPRVINQLCDNSLLFAYGRESKQVTIQDVTDAISTQRRWQKPLAKEAPQPVPAPAPVTVEVNYPAAQPKTEPEHKDQPVPATTGSEQSLPSETPAHLTDALANESGLPFKLPPAETNASPPPQKTPPASERKVATFANLPFPTRQVSGQNTPAEATVPNFLNLKQSTEQAHAPLINESMVKLIQTGEHAPITRFILPVALLALASIAAWFFLQPAAPQNNMADISTANQAASVATPPLATGERLNLSMASSISSNEATKGKDANSNTPIASTNEFSQPPGISMPAITNHRMVAIPKDGGIARVAAETFGLWNETARDLIYATNPEVVAALNTLPTGTQLRIPALTRDALIIKNQNGGAHVYYGSFTSAEEAQAELQIVRRIWGGSQIQTVTRQGATIYRIFVGPFPSKADASTALESMWFKHLPALN